MATEQPVKPSIRFAKNFIVEQHLDAVRWPQTCCSCGQPAEVYDNLQLKEKFKNYGEIRVQVTGIPYCQQCAKRSRTGKLVNRAVYVAAFIIGIPLAVLLILAASRSSSTRFIFCGLIIVLSLLVGYGLAWLLIKLPVKLILRKRLVEPVDAWIIEDDAKSDGTKGVSVVISIPNKRYAASFAELNGVSQ